MIIEEDYQLVYLGKKIQREEKAEEDYDETIDKEEAKQDINEKKEQEQEDS